MLLLFHMRQACPNQVIDFLLEGAVELLSTVLDRRCNIVIERQCRSHASKHSISDVMMSICVLLGHLAQRRLQRKALQARKDATVAAGVDFCIAVRHTKCMTQLVARVDDSLVADVDRMIASGVVASRSEAMRLGLERLVEQYRRHQIGAKIVDAYARRPQTEEELAGLDASTRALVDEEPW